MGVTAINPNMTSTTAVVAEGSFNVMTVRVVFILDDVEAARVLQIFYTFIMKRRAATGGRKVAAIEKMPTVIGKESVGMATTILRLLCRVQQRKLSWSLMPLIVELLSTVRNFLGSADSRGSGWSLIEDSDPMKMAAILDISKRGPRLSLVVVFAPFKKKNKPFTLQQFRKIKTDNMLWPDYHRPKVAN